MSESDRRFQRYNVSAGSFSNQRVKVEGFLGSLKGWGGCKVKDMSEAGALVLTKRLLSMGDTVIIEMTPRGGVPMNFRGEVVNIGTEHVSGWAKLGVRLITPGQGSREMTFLETLSDHYKISA